MTQNLEKLLAAGLAELALSMTAPQQEKLLAYVVLLALGLVAWRFHRSGVLPAQARWIGGLALLQLATGLSNVVLDWPLVAAVLHTGGAAALVVVLTWTLVSSRAATAPQEFSAPTGASRGSA